MTHSIEFLKKAREVGATHCYKGRMFDLTIKHLIRVDCGSILPIDMQNADYFKKYGVYPIDFTPLDDYYADKQLDINVTGVSE